LGHITKIAKTIEKLATTDQTFKDYITCKWD